MKHLLLNSVSYPTMNLIKNIYDGVEARKDEKFIEHMKKVEKDRIKKILKGPTYKPVFS